MESKKPEPPADKKPEAPEKPKNHTAEKKPVTNDNAARKMLPLKKMLQEAKDFFASIKFDPTFFPRMKEKLKAIKWPAVKKAKSKNTKEPKPKAVGWRRTWIWGFEALAVVAVLLALVTGVVVWRISSGPVDIGFAKDYIEDALYSPDRDISTSIESVVLHWPDLQGPVLLGLKNVAVRDTKGSLIVGVDEAALGLSRGHLLIGRVAPVALILKGPAVRVIRTEDNKFNFGLGAQAENQSFHTDDQEALVTRIIERVAHPGAENDSQSPLAALEIFEMQDARVVVEDYTQGISWFLPEVDATFASSEEGLNADFTMQINGGRDTDAFVKAALSYDWDEKILGGVVQVKNLDTRILAGKIQELSILGDQDIVLDAAGRFVLDENLGLSKADAVIRSAVGLIKHDDLSTESVPYENLEIEASYDAADGVIAVPKASVNVRGVNVQAEANLIHTNISLFGPVKVTIPEATHEKVAALWPEAYKEDNSHEWIVNRMSDATFYGVYTKFDLDAQKGEQGWQVNAAKPVLGFAYENLTVDYNKPMTPVTKAKGVGFFDVDSETLTVSVEDGRLGAMEVHETELVFKDIIKRGAGVADLNINLKGPLSSVLEYVNKEPIGAGHGFALDKVKGETDLKINLNFPTRADLKTEQVKIDITGTARDAVLPDLVRDLDLTGGPFVISVKGNELKVAGSGALGGEAVKAEYSAFLNSKGKPHKARARASLTATPALRSALGIDLSEFLEGSVPVSTIYTQYSEGRAEIEIAGDLKPARLFIDPFDYEKPAGTKGQADLRVRLKDGALQGVQITKATAPEFQLETTTLVFDEKDRLSYGDISRFVLGETVAKAEFEIEKSGRLKIALEGPFLDLRPFLNKDPAVEKAKAKDDKQAVEISIAVDRMRTAEKETVQYGKIYADIDTEGRFNQFELDAIAGKGDVYMRFKPDDKGMRTFRLEADDAGAALRAFAVYDKMEGGKLQVYGEPIRGIYDRNLLGVVEITDFKVMDAPVLARLLGAMSLPGVVQLLDNEGVTFTKLEAKFDWLYKPKGSLLVLKEGRTSGNSLGLTFDGTFDNAAGNLDVSGTIVPLSGVNKVLSSIPLIGDILSGGTDSVFAATYTVKGKAEEPEVSVNPLSVLAPGILRRILFE